jgi:hypothetical protein
MQRPSAFDHAGVGSRSAATYLSRSCVNCRGELADRRCRKASNTPVIVCSALEASTARHQNIANSAHGDQIFMSERPAYRGISIAARFSMR